MRIAVNTRLLLPGKLDGIGWFTFHTMKRITSSHPSVQFIFLFDRPWSQEFIFNSNITPVSVFPQARHPFLYYLWFNIALPGVLKKYKADLFLSPDGYLSLPSQVLQVPVIHDINFEHYPRDLPFLTRNYYRHFFPQFARKATRIATVSQFSKDDIVNCYGIDASKIDVVYNGVNESYTTLDENQKQLTRGKYADGCSYFLFVGMLHQRKNISNLLRAYDYYRSRSGERKKLLIVGHRKWWTSEMQETFDYMQYKNDVIFPGRQPLNELVKITGAAFAMIYISVFEGFGVPVIEAMRCGVPVITSNVTAMPEIAGDAALLTDPFNFMETGNAMLRLESDPSLWKKLSDAGLKRCGEFSWDRSAALLWETIDKALASKL